MSSYKPWSLTPRGSTNLTIFYGDDLAMSLSLARCYSNKLIEKAVELLQEDLFNKEEQNAVKLIIDNPDTVIAWHKRGLIHKKTILICTCKSLKEVEDTVDYIKCESLNSKTREWFINWHCKRLNLQIPKNLIWVKNLDDLLFAFRLEKQGLSYTEKRERESLWSEMRLNRFRYKADQSAIWEHFELWIKENSIKEEYIWFFMQQVKEEIRLHSS